MSEKPVIEPPVTTIIVFVGIAHRVCHIEAENKEGNIQTEAKSCIDSELIIEFIESKLGIGHGFIGMIGPNISGINEDGTVEDVVDRETVLGIEFQLDIASFLNVIGNRNITTRSHCAIKPSTQAIGTTAIETALETNQFWLPKSICWRKSALLLTY